MVRYVTCNGKVLANHILVADTYFKRLRGLLGKSHLEEGEGLLLTRCSSIHCFFMKFTIDVVYLSKEYVILDYETVQPWRIGKIVKGTAHVLELGEEALKGQIQKGDQLDFKTIE
jgi:uncharacterized protein